MPTTLCWRRLDGTRLAGFNRGLLHDKGIDGDATTVMGVGDLSGILLEECEKRGVEVKWGHKVVGLGQDEKRGKAWVDVEDEETGKQRRFESDFLVGCDGGNSAVRRLLFGKGNFPGFTWEEQIVATNVGSYCLF